MKNLQQDKRVTFDRDALFNLDNVDENLHLLTARDVAFFASIATVALWRSRWLNTSPSQFDSTQDYAADAIKRLFMTVDFCQRVAECITNDPSVQNALASQSTTGGNANTEINNTVYSNTVLIAENADANGCTDDARYGRIDALVDYIDQVQLDFYESIDAALNVLGEIAILVSAIPLFETLPIDEIIDTLANTGEQWEDSYTASVNTQLLEDFKCELWCNLADCDVTIKDVRQLIESRYNIDSTQGFLNTLSASALLARIAATVGTAGGLTYIGDDFVFLSWLLQIAAVEATGKFFGVAIGDYVAEAANGTPSGLWSGCTPCPTEWCYNVPLAPIGTLPGNIPANSIGGDIAFNNGDGCSPLSDVINALLDIPSAVTVSRVEFDVSQWTDVCNSGVLFWQLRDNSTLYATSTPVSGTGTYSVTLPSPQAGVTKVRFARRFATTDDIRISGIRIYGTGTAPAFAGNC